MLSVRDFKQIAGRAGRKGFDDQGQRGGAGARARHREARRAPRAASGKRRRGASEGGRAKGEVILERGDLRQARSRGRRRRCSRASASPTAWCSNLLQRDAELDDPGAAQLRVAARADRAAATRTRASKARLLAHAAVLVRSLYRAGIIRMTRDTRTRLPLGGGRRGPAVGLLAPPGAVALPGRDARRRSTRESPDYALDVITLVESILEDPESSSRKQVRHAPSRSCVAQLKAEGVAVRGAHGASSRRSRIPSRSPTSSTAPSTTSAAPTPGWAARRSARSRSAARCSRATSASPTT